MSWPLGELEWKEWRIGSQSLPVVLLLPLRLLLRLLLHFNEVSRRSGGGGCETYITVSAAWSLSQSVCGDSGDGRSWYGVGWGGPSSAIRAVLHQVLNLSNEPKLYILPSGVSTLASVGGGGRCASAREMEEAAGVAR